MRAAAHVGAIEEYRAGKEASGQFDAASQLAVFEGNRRFGADFAAGADGGILNPASRMYHGIAGDIIAVAHLSSAPMVIPMPVKISKAIEVFSFTANENS
jgi:hypothetical protein